METAKAIMFIMIGLSCIILAVGTGAALVAIGEGIRKEAKGK